MHKIALLACFVSPSLCAMAMDGGDDLGNSGGGSPHPSTAEISENQQETQNSSDHPAEANVTEDTAAQDAAIADSEDDDSED